MGRQPSEGPAASATPVLVIPPILASVWQAAPAGNRAGSMLLRPILAKTPSQRASPTERHAAETLGSSPATRLSVTRSRNAAYTAAPSSTAPIVIAMIFLCIVVRPFLV